MVDIGEDHVTITDEHGCEIVTWVDDEWIEDPSVWLSICNAIKMYYEKGACYLKQSIGK